jgi:bifunctional DNA-binding transcriptional regulator/antitoxin component of YhaV-PrlF toxin-antitoxin module
MEVVRLGKKGQITIPRSVLNATGISDAAPLLVEATEDGAIVLRQAGVYPIEIYSDKRIEEFERSNAIPADLEVRAAEAIRRTNR